MEHCYAPCLVQDVIKPIVPDPHRGDIKLHLPDLRRLCADGDGSLVRWRADASPAYRDNPIPVGSGLQILVDVLLCIGGHRCDMLPGAVASMSLDPELDLIMRVILPLERDVASNRRCDQIRRRSRDKSWHMDLEG